MPRADEISVYSSSTASIASRLEDIFELILTKVFLVLVDDIAALCDRTVPDTEVLTFERSGYVMTEIFR